MFFFFFFFNDTATTEIYTLSLHERSSDLVGDRDEQHEHGGGHQRRHERGEWPASHRRKPRSEEHTSELQSRQYLVCRLLLEKKKKKKKKKKKQKITQDT